MGAGRFLAAALALLMAVAAGGYAFGTPGNNLLAAAGCGFAVMVYMVAAHGESLR